MSSWRRASATAGSSSASAFTGNEVYDDARNDSDHNLDPYQKNDGTALGEEFLTNGINISGADTPQRNLIEGNDVDGMIPNPIVNSADATNIIRDNSGEGFVYQYLPKTATESVSNTTLQNDDHFNPGSVEKYTTYEIELFVLYDGAAAGDIKLSWTKPSSATMSWTIDGLDASDAQHAAIYSESSTPVLGCAGAGTTRIGRIKGKPTVAGTSGTFRLQWAQNASDATASRILAGSYMKIQKVS